MLNRCIFVLLLVLVCGCSYHQRNSHRVVSVTPSTSQKTNLKNFQYSQQAYGGLYTLDPTLSQYLGELTQKSLAHSMHPEGRYRVVIVNSSIPNIWSFQEGYLAITRGLLTELENEAELVGILCHEMAHLHSQDGTSSIQKVILNAGPVRLDILGGHSSNDFAVGPLGSGSGLITLKYDTQGEVSADRTSIQQMRLMGYAPQALLDFEKRVGIYKKSANPNWTGGYIAKHPISEYQIERCDHCQSQYSTSDGKYQKEIFAEKIKFLKSQAPAYQKLDLGYEALLNQNYEEAIRLADEGHKLQPQETHFFLLKAKAQAKLGYMPNALQTLNHAIKQNPYYFDLYLQRGLVKEQLDDWASACHDLERSLALLPTAEAYYALGEIDYNNERQAEAIEYFRKASISASPGGIKAVKKLKDLGLPISGVQALEVKSSFTDSGHLNLEVQNKGNTVAKSIVVDVEQHDAKGKLLYRHHIEIKQDLHPYEAICQKTNIGPFFSKEHMKESTSVFPVYCESP